MGVERRGEGDQWPGHQAAAVGAGPCVGCADARRAPWLTCGNDPPPFRRDNALGRAERWAGVAVSGRARGHGATRKSRPGHGHGLTGPQVRTQRWRWAARRAHGLRACQHRRRPRQPMTEGPCRWGGDLRFRASTRQVDRRPSLPAEATRRRRQTKRADPRGSAHRCAARSVRVGPDQRLTLKAAQEPAPASAPPTHQQSSASQSPKSGLPLPCRSVNSNE